MAAIAPSLQDIGLMDVPLITDCIEFCYSISMQTAKSMICMLQKLVLKKKPLEVMSKCRGNGPNQTFALIPRRKLRRGRKDAALLHAELLLAVSRILHRRDSKLGGTGLASIPSDPYN